ncbi:hypothetical protein [Rhinolophus gammaherpesvirus 1]|uniref:Uncharacterized protein n=1 Tax=Rhinolophus gammaherpesvirus 1 TaxID=2054179 RepID=A0A2Z5UHW7_9GAMA|nr:hypothetical protein [Rhinolophus gammaherpesvirus 1]BBB06482.1 hypothetical protein [Rhinolophus gammaherpesvirus 1]
MASGGSDTRSVLRKFLNKECVWKKSSESTEFMKVYFSTTSISPVFKPTFRKKLGCHAFNVTAILMKPKGCRTCATFYINGFLVETCEPEVIFTRPVPGPLEFCLIYFGPFGNPATNFSIPIEPTISAPQNMKLMTKMEVLDTSIHIHPSEIETIVRGVSFIQVGRCLWYDGECLYTFFLSMDYMMCCPRIEEHQSLSRFINLVSKCDNGDCVPCYGKKIHANVAGGYTDPNSNGRSHTCPCTLSCSSLSRDVVPVTGNKGLLSLLFGPMSHSQVQSLKFFPCLRPKKLSEVMCGVGEDGRHIPVKAEAWIMLKMSAFYSRCAIYECQILKRKCLHSY